MILLWCQPRRTIALRSDLIRSRVHTEAPARCRSSIWPAHLLRE